MSAVDDWLDKVDPNADAPVIPSGPGLTSAEQLLASKTITELQQQLVQVQFQVATSHYDSGALSGINTSLKLSGELLTQLKGPQLDDVVAGRRPWSWWVESAQLIHDNTATAGGLSKDWNFSGTLWASVVQTGDVQGAVQSVGGGFGVGAILGLLAVGYVWWKA